MERVNKSEWINKILDNAKLDRTYNFYCIYDNVIKIKGFLALDNHGNTGYSLCHPDDNFDEMFGRALAYARMRKIKVPEFTEYKYVNVEELAGCIINYKGHKFYVTPVPVMQFYKIGTKALGYSLINLNRTTEFSSSIWLEKKYSLMNDCIINTKEEVDEMIRSGRFNI